MEDEQQHVLDWLPAYSVGALEGEELLKVTQHLEICAACRADLAAYQQVIDQIPLVVPIHKPPTQVKLALLRRIQLAQENRLNWFDRMIERLNRPTPAWALVCLVVILIVAVFVGAGLWRQNQQLIKTNRTEFSVVNLTGSVASTANGWIVVSKNGQSGTLIVQGLPFIQDNQDYQLWLFQNGQPTNGGVFWVDQDGYASLWVNAPRPLIDYQSFEITVEPYGGSSHPTGSSVIAGQFQ